MNAPFYLSYLLNQERLENYEKMAKQLRDSWQMTGTLVTWDLNSGEEMTQTTHNPTTWVYMRLPADTTRWVAVCSDGM